MTSAASELLCDVDVSHFAAYTGAFISDLSLAARAGDCVWVSGPTGSGKSTILRLLALKAERATTPVIAIGPRAEIRDPLRILEMRSLPDLAYVSQETAENLVAATARADIETSLMNEGGGSSTHTEKVLAVLGDAEAALDRNWRKLSSGWRQLVSAISAGVLSRRVYLFDEPLANLDAENAARVVAIFRVLRDRGAAVILASHDVRMLAGEITATCTGWNLERVDRSATLTELLTTVVGSLEEMAPAELEARELTVSLGNRTVLERCSLKVSPGDSLAVVGPNGSGKTTLARALAGLQRPEAGTVSAAGRALKRPGSWVGYSPQSSRHALLGRDLGEEIRLSIPPSLQAHFLKCLRDHLDLKLDALSFGERKLISLVMAVAGRPLCVLDEPLAGLDGDMIQKVQALLAQARGCGRGIVSFVPQGQLRDVAATRVVSLLHGAMHDDVMG